MAVTVPATFPVYDPLKVVYGSDAYRELPVTVVEGANWLFRHRRREHICDEWAGIVETGTAAFVEVIRYRIRTGPGSALDPMIAIRLNGANGGEMAEIDILTMAGASATSSQVLTGAPGIEIADKTFAGTLSGLTDYQVVVRLKAVGASPSCSLLAFTFWEQNTAAIP